MPFVFLLVFALISFQTAWPPADWLDPYASLVAPWALAFVSWLVADWHALLFRFQLARHPNEHARLWRRYARTRRRLTMLVTACYLGILFGLGWGALAQEAAQVMRLTGLAELIQFAPYLLAVVLLWWQSYHAEAASHAAAPAGEPFVGRWTYLGFQVRHNLLLVVPPFILTLTLRSFFALFPSLENDAVLTVTGFALAAGAVISVPLILRVFLGLRPMPAGPLRSRLEAAGQRLGFGFSNILVWDTRQTVANAMVTGTVRRLRYIVLTDLLLERLTPEEIEAVFGHEVGHIKHHHMALYIAFFLGSLALLTGAWKLCEDVVQPALTQVMPTPVAALTAGWSAPAEFAAGPVLLAAVAAYIFVVFGFLSRRCERQADLFGCRAVSTEAFIAALEKVADLNGIPRHRGSIFTSWQHPTICERVEFVAQMRAQPALESRFQHSLLRLKLGLLVGLALGLGVVMTLMASQLPEPGRVWEIFRIR